MVARLRFFPFLTGRIEIADVSLVRPTIAIVFNADRTSNWSGHIETLARNLKPSPGRTSSFSEIRIEDGTVILRDEAYKLIETLSNVEMALAWPSISRSFAATGRLAWHDEPIDATISFTDFVAALNGDSLGLKLRLAGAPFKFAFDGYISHRPTLKMEGTLAADAASLRDTLRWAGQQPPPGGGFGRFALKAQTNVVGSTIGLSNVNVELDGNTGEGVLTFDGRQTLQGTLAAEALDLTPYVSTVRLLTSGERGWDGRPIALDGLDGIDVDLGSRQPASLSPAPSSGAPRSRPLCAAVISPSRSASRGLRRRRQGHIRARQVGEQGRLQGAAAILQYRSRAMSRRAARHSAARGQRQPRIGDR